MTRAALFVGLDLGGSGTRAALADAEGNLLALGLGPTGLVDTSGAASNRQLARALDAALAPIARRITAADACRVFAGTRGLSVPGRRERLELELTTRFPRPAQVHVSSDAHTGLWGGLSGQPGVAVIAGAGSIALARAADGRQARAGGWGYLLGDEGSGYWLGREAVRGYLRMLEGSPQPGNAGATEELEAGERRTREGGLQRGTAGATEELEAGERRTREGGLQRGNAGATEGLEAGERRTREGGLQRGTAGATEELEAGGRRALEGSLQRGNAGATEELEAGEPSARKGSLQRGNAGATEELEPGRQGAREGGGPHGDSWLGGLVGGAIGGASVADVLGWFYAGRDQVERLAALAPLVSQAAEAGDPVASDILQRAGTALANIAAAAARQVFADAEIDGLKVVSIGGVWRAGDALTSAFEQRLADLLPGAHRAKPSLPPLGGALLLAMGAEQHALDPAVVERLAQRL